MAQVVLGIFPAEDNAESALHALQDLGIDGERISIVMGDRKRAEELADSAGEKAGKGATTGLVGGAVVGGLAGLAVGLSAVAVPGVGPLLIGGPIATALGLTGAAATTTTGAIVGAASGGIIGALGGLGLSQDEADKYERRIKEGAVLLAVPASEGESEIQAIMNEHGAEEVRTVDATRAEHWESDPWEVPA